MATLPNLPGLSRADLEALLVELLGQVVELKALVAAQRDEIARLKGRPSIKPSGMEKNTQPLRGGKDGKGGEHRRRGKVTPRVKVETEVLRAVHPPGSQP